MITGLSKPIRDFLRQDRQYLIPRYQREYVWEEKQWSDLFNDLVLNYRKWKESPNIECHFIGSIVVLENKTDRYAMADIIDGQQRMTTFFILLLAIMRKANQLSYRDLFYGIRDYLKAKSAVGEKYDKFQNADNPYFKVLLDNCTTYTDQIDLISDNQDIVKKHYAFQEKFIYQCFQYMYTLLCKEIENGIDIIEFTNRIMGTIIIETLSTNVSESYTIFEILNARGKQLENHELIKNYVMRYYEPTDLGDVALKDWQLLMDLLKNNSVTPRNFFEHYISHRFDRTNEKRGKKSLTAYDYIVRNCQQRSKELLDDLLKKAKIYIYFSKPSNFPTPTNEYCKRISDGLLFFKGRSKTQFRPLFLSLFSRLYSSTHIDSENMKLLSDMVYFLERFFFIYGVVLKSQSKPLERIVHKYAYQIENAEEERINSYILELKNELAKVLPDYETFENAFCNLGYSTKNIRYSDEEGNKDDVRYILALYEKYLRGSTADIEPFSIEHIHRDTGTDTYCKIGNLVCLNTDENTRLGRKSASEKIPSYNTSEFISAQKIAKDYSGKWENAQINARGKEIAKVLYEDVWEAREAAEKKVS